MVLEIFSSLDLAIVKALITGLATSIGKVAAESGLKVFGQGADKLLDGAGHLTQQAIDLFIPIARKYFENYAKRHGEFKILGMNKPLSIEYDRAVSTLLSEWDTSKEIVRHQRYKNLDRKGKEELLSEIAYTKLEFAANI
jgi:hypothetical protein